jgi:hypothetical protein
VFGCAPALIEVDEEDHVVPQARQTVDGGHGHLAEPRLVLDNMALGNPQPFVSGCLTIKLKTSSMNVLKACPLTAIRVRCEARTGAGGRGGAGSLFPSLFLYLPHSGAPCT